MRIDYAPPPSLEPLFTRPKFWNVVIGPVGSTKTTACIFWLLSQAWQQHPGADGIRRTRYVVSRTSLLQLRMTVMRDILHWLGPLVQHRASENLLVIDQPPIYSEWFLVPLEAAQDQRRLLSLQLSGIWFNEAREVPWTLVNAAASRIPRYPPATAEGVRRPFVLMDSNPGDIGSPLYQLCMSGDPDLLYIHQPSGLDPAADWLKYLPPRYYERMAAHAEKDWVSVHVHAKWGRDKSGASVFSNCFDPDIHLVEETPPDRSATWLIGIDPGRQPAALFGQVDENGVLHIVEEHHASNTAFSTFLHRSILPWVHRRPNQPVLAVMDPAGRIRSGTRDESPHTMLREHGIDAVTPGSNDPEIRIAAVERMLLLRTVSGAGMLRINRVNCPKLVEALQGGYKWTLRADGSTFGARPQKLHPISDLADCLQYLCMAVGGLGAARLRDRAAARVVQVTSSGGIDLRGWI